MPKFMDHAGYVRSLRTKSDDELEFIAKDAAEAAAVYPASENTSYYLDEVLYCQQELNRRRHKKAA